MVLTAKMHRLNGFKYLEYIFDQSDARKMF